MTRTEAWAEARRLVVHEQASYKQASDATGIALSTIQKRAAGEDWQGQRDTASSYANTVRALKSAMLAKALESKDPNDVHAWEKIERAWPEHRYNPDHGGASADEKRAIALEVLSTIIEHLAETDPSALRALQPHVVQLGEAIEAKYAA